MAGLLPPPLVFHGKRWPTEILTAMALSWRASLGEQFRASTRPIAMIMDNHPQSVALFFALSCVRAPLILLPLDLKSWRSAPPLPPDTRLVLLPTQRRLEGEARPFRFDVTLLSEHGESGDALDAPPFMAAPGLVLFTSGSTGLPRPVYRGMTALLHLARTLVATLGLRHGDGLIANLPLARAFGLNHGLLVATVLQSSLALLDRFDHNALLRLFASRERRFWAGTPMMADVLSRCPLPEAHHPAPDLCLIGGRVSAEVARRFKERFGVPLRQIYGTTETGSIAVEAAPDAEVRSDRTGRPLPGVEVRIGDDPRAPFSVGTPGRIWISTEFMMGGYGFPPDLELPETADGWWGSPDRGLLDAGGDLSISDRLDDTFRTDAGQLVNPASVAAALEGYPGIIDAAVVPLAAPTGPVLGVLVESVERLSVADLRGHLARSLPSWSRPRVIEATSALPRLPSGRIDRRACIAILEKSLRGGDSA